MQTVEEFLVSGIFAFLLIFTRMGTAMMIMPGIGDSFVNTRVRLLMALGISFVLTPVIQGYMPEQVPSFPVLFSLIMMEFVTGLFVGTMARIFMIALDVAGMLISTTSGLSNAQVFNPAFSSQGSITGAFLSMTGVVLLFATNLHHMLIYGLVESYKMFPVGAVPDTGSMAQLMTSAFSTSFLIGFQIAIPFVVVAIMLYIGMGVLSRLMPQVQVFILALPVQIMLALVTLSLSLSAIFLFWLTKYEAGMMFFLSQGG